MATSAQDILDRMSAFARNRLDHEWSWRQIAKLAAPDVGEFDSYWAGRQSHSNTITPLVATTARRSKDIYDSTAVWSVERLASGIESLVTPSNEYWHDLDLNDLTRHTATDAEARYFEKLRNLLFKVRYDSDSGFIAASQTCYRRLVGFGNGFMMVEEGDNPEKALISYRYIPITQSFAAENHAGTIDTFMWPYTLTARQAVQKFGRSVHPSIAAAAEHVTDKDKLFPFVQMIAPRGDCGYSIRNVVSRTPVASIHVDAQNQMVVRESGFYTFPVVDFRWLPEPGQVYGEGPIAKVLADIQSLNVMAKNELVASDLAVKPPLLVPHAGIVNRPKVAPREIIVGGMSMNGQKMVEPLHTIQRVDFAAAVRQMKQEQVKNGLYINLFQILVENPRMTATEALIRANEKGELLGPAGTRLQQSLSNLVDREIDILVRRGLYDIGSEYRPPRSLQEKRISPSFSGPINRLRMTKEAEGISQYINITQPLATISPEVNDVIHPIRMAKKLASVLGVPKDALRTEDEFAAEQTRKQQVAAMEAQSIAARNTAAAAKDGAAAMQTLQQVGL